MPRILVVDDHTSYRSLLKDLLELERFDVRTAGQAQEAIDLGREFVPDVLIVDHMLRDILTGLEVAATLSDELPTLRTILITGYSSRELEDEVSRASGVRSLTKPFDFEELLAAVRDALGP